MAVKTNDFDQANIRSYGDLTICESIRYGFKYTTKVRWEEVTVGAAATTSSTATLIPANCRVDAVAHRITAVIPTTDGTMDLGTAASATAFQDDAETDTVGNTGVKHLATEYTAATGVRITPCSTPTAATGKVMIVVFYTQVTAPTSSP